MGLAEDGILGPMLRPAAGLLGEQSHFGKVALRRVVQHYFDGPGQNRPALNATDRIRATAARLGPCVREDGYLGAASTL